MGTLERKFTKCLKDAKREMDAHAFLKKHPHLVGMQFCPHAMDPSGVWSEFRLAEKYKCDFVVLSFCSGWWWVDFVELESSLARLYNANGTPTRTLQIALRQISDWKTWLDNNKDYFRRQLSDVFKQANIAASADFDGADTEILKQDCLLSYRFHIVIGRRASLSDTDDIRRHAQHKESGIQIATYDRLVDTARSFDKEDSFKKQRLKHHHRLRNV